MTTASHPDANVDPAADCASERIAVLRTRLDTWVTASIMSIIVLPFIGLPIGICGLCFSLGARSWLRVGELDRAEQRLGNARQVVYYGSIIGGVLYCIVLFVCLGMTVSSLAQNIRAIRGTP